MLGFGEMAMLPIALVTAAVPLATLVVAIMIYRRLGQIEQRLDGERH